MGQNTTTIDRRSFLGAATATLAGSAMLGSGAAYAQTGNVGGADAVSAALNSAPSDVIMRQIPCTGESVTALGLGTFLTLDARPGQSRDTLLETVRRYVAGGGRLIDTSPLYGSAEVNVGAALAALPGQERVFVANKIWSTGEYLGDTSHAEASLEQSRLRIWRDQIDAMQCHSMTNAAVIVPLLRTWKQEGRIRYVGVTHHASAFQNELSTMVESGNIDVVQTNYSIFNRTAEERLLRAAADQGVAVLVNLPLEKARLTHIVEGRPLPDFAGEFGAMTWAQFFLKWVIAHPAVTTVLCGTSNPDHAADNVQAMRGPLPDEAMRRRMVAYMETIPGFADIGRMAWYPGKDTMYQGLIRGSQAEARERLAE